MTFCSCFYSKAILKISQAEGLRRTPSVGVPLSPYLLWAGSAEDVGILGKLEVKSKAGGCSGNHGRG